MEGIAGEGQGSGAGMKHPTEWYAQLADPLPGGYRECVSCGLPVDMSKAHHIEKKIDVFCIPCAVSGGWLTDPENLNVKAVLDRQLANGMRKRRFR